jgi:hypothetical protein
MLYNLIKKYKIIPDMTWLLLENPWQKKNQPLSWVFFKSDSKGSKVNLLCILMQKEESTPKS